MLLLLGGDSPAFEKDAAEALDAAMPDSRIVVIAHQGHLAHRTAPQVFVREVVQFLMRSSAGVRANREDGAEEAAS